MPDQSSVPRRRHPRLQGYDYRQPGAYFITLCTFRRVCFFGKIISGEMQINDFGKVVLHCWQQLPNHFVNTALDAFIVMPNHIHGIIHITNYPVGARHASPDEKVINLNPGGPWQASPEKPTVNPNPVGARHTSPLQIKSQPTVIPIGLRYASLACRSPSLGHLVGSLKSASTRQIRKLSSQPGLSVWQRGYYEHIIRNDESLTRIREYILNNPLSWHLDRENQEATGQDAFDRWLDNQKTVPVKKNTP